MFAWPPGSNTAAPQAWARGAAPAGRGPARPDSTSRPLPDQLDSQPVRQSASPSFDQPASERPNQLFSEPAIQLSASALDKHIGRAGPRPQGAAPRAQTARREHCQTEAEGEAVRPAASQPVSHQIDLLLLFPFFGNRCIIVIGIYKILFGVDAGIIFKCFR